MSEQQEIWIPVWLKMPGQVTVKCLSNEGREFDGVFDYDFQSWVDKKFSTPVSGEAVTHWKPIKS